MIYAYPYSEGTQHWAYAAIRPMVFLIVEVAFFLSFAFSSGVGMQSMLLEMILTLAKDEWLARTQFNCVSSYP